jgi:hypothetical protein
MFLNSESGLVITAVIVFGIFTYTFYNHIFITAPNTSIVYKEVGVLTDSLVNTTAMQPSIDSISELPESTYPCIEPNILPDGFHVEAGVQTSDLSLWSLFTDWIIKKY